MENWKYGWFLFLIKGKRDNAKPLMIGKPNKVHQTLVAALKIAQLFQIIGLVGMLFLASLHTLLYESETPSVQRQALGLVKPTTTPSLKSEAKAIPTKSPASLSLKLGLSVVGLLIVGSILRYFWLKKPGWFTTYQSSQQGNQKLVQLEEQPVHVNQAKEEWTPLHIACYNGDLSSVVKLLNDHHADVNPLLEDSVSPLFIACWKGHIAIVKQLLDDPGVVVNGTTKEGATPLLIACYQGHDEIVRLLLQNSQVAVDQALEDGATPLFAACQRGHSAIVKMLLETKKVAINAYEKKYHHTPLYIACQEGHSAVVALLVADPQLRIDQPDISGATPLYIACYKGHTAIVSLLLQQQAAIHQPTKNGYTPYRIAHEGQYRAIIALLNTDKYLKDTTRHRQ